MIQYIPIDSVLSDVPQSIRKETTDSDLVSHFLDAYRMLSVPGEYQRTIKIVELVEHIASVPDDAHAINLITWTDSLATDETTNDFPIQNDRNYNLFYQIFQDSLYYNQKFQPLRNVGNSSSLICGCCNNPLLNKCGDTFSILPDKSLMCSIRNGWLCIDYDRELIDENGNYLIIKSPEVKRYLSLYGVAQSLFARSMSKEEQTFSMYEKILGQTEIAYKRAKGALTLGGIDIHTINAISGTETYNQKLIRLPDLFYRKYNN